MKHFVWVLLWVFSAQAAAASTSLHCRSNFGKYTVWVYLTKPSTAKVLVGDKEVEFGALVCTADSESADCMSDGVADAGFRLHVSDLKGTPAASLFAISFAGEEKLADLTCHYDPTL